MLISWSPSTLLATRLDVVQGHLFSDASGLVLSPGGGGLYVVESISSIWYFNLTSQLRVRKDDPTGPNPLGQVYDVFVNDDGTKLFYMDR
jgi:hypothetical protein